MNLAKKLLLTLLVCLALSHSKFSILHVSASASVTGVISENTTWGMSDSPFTLTGNILVQSGVILTIEPGVVVDFGIYYLQIEGTLRAIGTEETRIKISGVGDQHNNKGRIYFTDSSPDWDEEANSGSILENCNISSLHSYPIEIQTSTCPKISKCYINMDISSGSPSGILANNGIIINNTLSHTSYPIRVHGTAQVSGYPKILNNTIRNNGNGIYLSSGSPTVTGNLFIDNAGNDGGIRIDYGCSPNISNNTIRDNDNGIVIINGQSPGPSITYNNIFGNAEYDLRLIDTELDYLFSYVFSSGSILGSGSHPGS